MKQKFFPSFFLILSSLFSPFLFSPFPPKASTKKETPKQILRGVHLVEAENGKKLWELWSNKIQGFKNGKDWVLKNLKIHFFSTKDTKFVLKGKKGFIENFNNKKRNILIEEQIKITKGKDYQFETEKIEYLSELQILKSLEHVRMKGLHKKEKKFDFQAKTMHIFLEKNVVQLEGKVSGSYPLKSPAWEETSLWIQSETLTLDHNKSQIKFENNVTLHIGKKKVQTSKVFLNYSSKTHEIHSLLLLGGVKVEEKDKIIQAESLKLEAKKDRLTFYGPAQINEKNNEFKAERIIVTEKGNHVKMMKAQLKFFLQNEENLKTEKEK